MRPYMESEGGWRVPSGREKCRGKGCRQKPVADMKRARAGLTGYAWWAYCADHLRGYNREVRDGRVWWLGFHTEAETPA